MVYASFSDRVSDLVISVTEMVNAAHMVLDVRPIECVQFVAILLTASGSCASDGPRGMA